MKPRFIANENLAFWLSPVASVFPLILFFGVSPSPWFIGKLMGEPAHPFLWPQSGTWLGTAGVAFDGMILAYLTAIPVYFLVFRKRHVRRAFLKNTGTLSLFPLLAVFGVAGILASQLVHLAQHFRQPVLRSFAESWMSPLFGSLCGLFASACFVMLWNFRFSPRARALLASLPIAVVAACGGILFGRYKARTPTSRG
jgi:hypothetical protein